MLKPKLKLRRLKQKKLRLLGAYHLQAANNSLNSLCRHPLATMMTVMVIAIALALPALFWVFTDNFEKLAVQWQRTGHISLYLKTSLSAADEATLLARVRSTEGVGALSFKSPADAMALLQQQEGMQDILRYLPQNPLPAIIEVIPAPAVNTPLQMDQLLNRLKAYPQVEQAKLDSQWVNKLYTILGFANHITHSFMVLLAIALVLIISNTLRLAVHNRQEEIQVLKLIGATDSFIARPFLYMGMWYSLAGAVLAVLLINIFMLSISLALKQLAIAYKMHCPIIGLSVKQAYTLVIVSVALGWLGAKMSVKRQLAFIEPYN